jgi:hypothetical protein
MYLAVRASYCDTESSLSDDNFIIFYEVFPWHSTSHQLFFMQQST